MRSVLVALVVMSAALLAGCASKGGGTDPATYTCPDGKKLNLDDIPGSDNATFNPLSKCGGTGTRSNTTASAPNVLPTLVLTTTDDGGNVTNVTMLDGNLTFSAEGSTDPDGSITGIAVSVTDSNTTRTATLYDSATKSFKSATFSFDRPGVVNVTVAMVDDRAGFTVNQSKVYVNHLQVGVSQNIALPGGSPAPGATDCFIGDSETGGPIIGAQFWKEISVTVADGATMIEAIAEESSETGVGTVAMTVCDPAANPMSEADNPTVTNVPGPFPAAPGTDNYFLGVTSSTEPRVDFVPTILVHYEPNPVAMFAEA